MNKRLEKALIKKLKENESRTGMPVDIEAALQQFRELEDFSPETFDYQVKQFLGDDIDLSKIEPPQLTEVSPGQYIFSANSYDFLLLKNKKGEGSIKMPNFTAKQDLLIDFIFGRLKKQVESLPEEHLTPISRDDFRFALLNIDELPPAFSGMRFTTTEVRKELNIRYPEKEMIEDFKKIRDGRIEARTVKIWADEDGKYKDTVNWAGSIIADVVDVKTERIVPRTGEPVHKIIMNIGLITGLLWRNDIIRKKYSLFPVNDDKRRNFGRLPPSAQKIYRYLSLWKYSILTLEQFGDILNYKPTKKQIRKFKTRIDEYLTILKEQGFIQFWKRIPKTRGWKTAWKIGQ